MKRVMSPSGYLDNEAVVTPLANQKSFEQFFKSERPAMIALAYATSGSRAVAEDITQEAFLAAHRNWERVGALDNPGTWIRRVVINKSISLVRGRNVAKRALRRLGVSSEQIEIEAVPAETEHIWVEVRRLPKRQRQVVALRYVGQLTMVEIGEVLGCSKETVNTHLRRANKSLALRLEN